MRFKLRGCGDEDLRSVMGRVRTLLVGGGIKAGKWGIVYRDEGRMRGRVVCCGFSLVWVVWVEGWVWYRDVCLAFEVRSPRVGLGRYDDR